MKTLPRTLWEVLKFEAVCKLLAICLVYPVLNGVFQIYAASEGLNFNAGVVSAFLSPAGLAVLLAVGAGATAFAFWELSTVIRIAALTRQGDRFTWRQLWWGSLGGLGALRGWSLPASAVFYLALVPLTAVGYVHTLLPTLALPEFIYSELRRYGVLGMAGMIAILALYYLLTALCLYVPLYMSLRRQRFFAAAGQSLQVWKRSFWRGGRPAWQGWAVVGACLAWVYAATRIAQHWRRNRLDLVDFDSAFFRNLLYSEAFRIDFAYWVVRSALDAAAMALFIRLLLAVADPEGALRAQADPAWQGDAAVLTGAILELVERYGVGDRLMFMSQDLTSVNTLQAAHPEWWVGYCAYGSTGDLDEGIWKYDVDFLAVEESMVSNRLARTARSQGLPLYVWSVYDSDKMLQYLQMGVVGLITDFPDIARDVVDGYRAGDTAPYRAQTPGGAARAA